MENCSYEECKAPLGFDAGIEEPNEVGQGCLSVQWNPDDIYSKTERFYCSIDCLLKDADDIEYNSERIEAVREVWVNND